MPLDINMFRTDRGGDPDVIKESQRRRFESPGIVDEVRGYINVFEHRWLVPALYGRGAWRYFLDRMLSLQHFVVHSVEKDSWECCCLGLFMVARERNTEQTLHSVFVFVAGWRIPQHEPQL